LRGHMLHVHLLWDHLLWNLLSWHLVLIHMVSRWLRLADLLWMHRPHLWVHVLVRKILVERHWHHVLRPPCHMWHALRHSPRALGHNPRTMGPPR